MSAMSFLRTLGFASPSTSIETPDTIHPSIDDLKPIGRLAYPALSLDALLAREQSLISALQEALNLPSSIQAELLTPVIARYAAFVHLLPASKAHHHAGMGGLLHHGLEVALWAVKASYAVIEDVEGPLHQQRQRAQTWRLTIAFASLLHDIGKPAADLIVTDQSGSLRWNPYQKSLLEWAEQHTLTTYYPSWRPNRSNRHTFFSFFVIGQVLPPKVVERLGSEGPELLEGLSKSLIGTATDHPMARLVHEADVKSAEHDLKSPYRQLNTALGIPIERYLIHAMWVLIDRGSWTINQPGAFFWILEDGHYLVWPNALGPMLEVLKEEAIPGIPRDPVVLTEILIERGVASERFISEHLKVSTWPMQPACLTTPLSMIKLREDLNLFKAIAKTPMAARLVVLDSSVEGSSPPSTVHTSEPLRVINDHFNALQTSPSGLQRPHGKRINIALKAEDLRRSATPPTAIQSETSLGTDDIRPLMANPILNDLLKKILDPRLIPLLSLDQGHLLLPTRKCASCLDMRPLDLRKALDDAGWLIHEPCPDPLEGKAIRLPKVLRLHESISRVIDGALQSQVGIKEGKHPR